MQALNLRNTPASHKAMLFEVQAALCHREGQLLSLRLLPSWLLLASTPATLQLRHSPAAAALTAPALTSTALLLTSTSCLCRL